jgi:hypothetical protein
MAKMPELIAAAALTVLIGCSAPARNPCDGKLSAGMATEMTGPDADVRTFEVVITLKDTTGLHDEFPALSFPNRQVALGHLTRSQILALCRHANVLSVERSKIFRPIFHQ